MQRPREERGGLGDLDDLPGVHQRNALRDLRHDAEVVRDQQQRHALRALQLDQQVEDLLLDRDVECGGGFVGNDDVRLAGQRDRDHHALLLPAGELERVAVDAPLRLRQADTLQPLQRPCPGGAAAQRRVPFDHLDDLPADGQDRVQARRRLLEDDAHPAAADIAHTCLGQLRDIRAVQRDAASRHAAVVRQQPQDRQCSHRLAAAGLADQCEGLAARERQRQRVDRVHQPAVGVEDGVETLDREHGVAHRPAPVMSTPSAGIDADGRRVTAGRRPRALRRRRGSRPAPASA